MYEEYLSEQDWTDLKAKRYLEDVATEVQLIGNASRALDAADFRQAIVEGAAALELVIGKRLSTKNKTIHAAIQSFLDGESQRAQAAVLMLALGETETAIEAALKVITLRNQVVHEGYEPTKKDTEVLRDVLKTTGRISGVGEIKSPMLTNGNFVEGPPSARAAPPVS